MKNAILITGAAGGLGTAIVKTFADKYPNLTIVATDINPEIEHKFTIYENVLGIEMNIASETSIATVKDLLEAQNILVSGLINNAGMVAYFPISEAKKSDLQEMFEVNALGAVYTVSAFLPHLKEARGRVIQVSSESVKMPGLFQPYPCTKVTLEALSVAMRNELALFGIKLIIVRPGAIQTPLLDKIEYAGKHVANSFYREPISKFGDKAREMVGNISKPEEVAGLILKAYEASRPKLYYHINNMKFLMLMKILPEKLKDSFMQKSVR